MVTEKKDTDTGERAAERETEPGDYSNHPSTTAQRVAAIEVVLGIGGTPVYGAGNKIVGRTTTMMSDRLAANDERVQSLQRTVARIEREVFPVLTMGQREAQMKAEDTGYTARIKTKCASAACALTQASEDFDAIQRRALELIVNMKHDGANPDVVIALADIATSLGDCSAACTLAAREARR